jgi:hypothetical protein
MLADIPPSGGANPPGAGFACSSPPSTDASENDSPSWSSAPRLAAGAALENAAARPLWYWAVPDGGVDGRAGGSGDPAGGVDGREGGSGDPAGGVEERGGSGDPAGGVEGRGGSGDPAGGVEERGGSGDPAGGV